MIEVKERLREMINSIGDGNKKQSSFNNKNSFSPARDLNTTDFNISTLSRTKSPSKGLSPTRGASSLNKNPRSPVKEKLELLCPTSSTVLKETKLSKKIKNEIDEFYKMIKKEDIPKGGYRNRPAVNLNKPELDFNSVSYLLTSPSNYRSFLTLKGEMSSNRGSYNKSNRSFISRQDDSFERFEKELGKSKNALLRSGSKKY